MTRGIRYISAHDHGGYGIAARRLLLGLKNGGVPFTWTPMTGGGGWDLWYEPMRANRVDDPDLAPFCYREIEYDTVVLHLVPEYTLRWRMMEPNRRFILHTVWETDRIPAHWRFFLELADLVIVPCEWNKEVFARAGLRVPVETLPHIAVPPATTAGTPPVEVRDGDFVFLTIDSWTARKDLGGLIRCYLGAFTADDPVTLVLKTTPHNLDHCDSQHRAPSSASEVRRIAREYRNPARIRLLTRNLSHDEIGRLHECADCFVCLSHGEGWGLGAFDAAAHGKPVIATGFGGPPEFLPPEDAFLVRSRPVPVRDNEGKPSFLPDQRWAAPDYRHAAELMRYVVANRGEAAARGRRLQSFVLDRFAERRIVERFMRIVDACPHGAPAEGATP